MRLLCFGGLFVPFSVPVRATTLALKWSKLLLGSVYLQIYKEACVKAGYFAHLSVRIPRNRRGTQKIWGVWGATSTRIGFNQPGYYRDKNGVQSK